MGAKELIIEGKTALGIELGSTRIKGVLIDYQGNVLAVGIHDWENSFIDNIWTYSLAEIHAGVRDCYNSLRKIVEETYGDWFDRSQCNDAWIYGTGQRRQTDCSIPDMEKYQYTAGSR